LEGGRERERERDFIGEGVSTRKRFLFLLSKKGKKRKENLKRRRKKIEKLGGKSLLEWWLLSEKQ